MAVNQYVGSWTHEKSEGLDEFLKAMGVGSIKRKMATTVNPSFRVELDGNKIVIHQKLLMKAKRTVFEFDVERTDQNPLDGKDVQVTETMDGEHWNTKCSNGVTMARSIVDGKLIVKQTFEGVTFQRTFVKAK
ncbi:putative myelin P2 protein [Apostichopus japonicus]|uniref:Putative myelin P2 protein n=1 Tax=Stichopus japonicus TaxID=307972 RepID=A0A2G8JSV2_STIJA|nr:putative myelin P2 protein [Apostichopus japonicus]